MGEVIFEVKYSNAGPQASPLYSYKMKTRIVATIPREMFDSVKGKFTDIFNDIMTNLGYGRHSPTLFSKGQPDDSSDVVEFGVKEGTGTIVITLYRPKRNVDAATETYIKNQLKEKIKSASGAGDPENVDGGRKTRRKTHKSKISRKSRSRKHKKTRKH
jgi:hypothetical protein